MTSEFLLGHIQWGIANAHIWGFILVFILMAIESSFIPFPSEITLIPAGFFAYRGALTFGVPELDMIIVILCGIAGSLVGAFFNYYFAFLLGRPFLYKYGKFFFVKPKLLNRSEEIFREYGEIATFVCRLLPGIRQLISLPAGLSKMSLGRFALFTGLGAGLWSAILTGIGYYLGSLSNNMSTREIMFRGKDILMGNYIWIVLILILIIAVYLYCHYLVMKPKKSKA